MNVPTTLRKIGVKPSKLYGQNFLVDKEVLEKIIEVANIKKGDRIVEIGPGLGVLTGALMAKGASVLAIEKQREFVDYLRNKFKHRNVCVVANNALLLSPS